MSTTPTPSMFAGKAPVALTFRPVVVTDLEVAAPAKAAANEVVKAKHLKAGQVVRAFLQGEARGGSHTVSDVVRIDDGATVEVSFTTRPAGTYKAAYRFEVQA